MSETLLRHELARLAELWPAIEAGTNARATDPDERLAELESRRLELEGELDEIDAEIREIETALGRDAGAPSARSTWYQVDEQIAIVEELAAQYNLTLPEHVRAAIKLRRLAQAAGVTDAARAMLAGFVTATDRPTITIAIGKPERLDVERTTP